MPRCLLAGSFDTAYLKFPAQPYAKKKKETELVSAYSASFHSILFHFTPSSLQIRQMRREESRRDIQKKEDIPLCCVSLLVPYSSETYTGVLCESAALRVVRHCGDDIRTAGHLQFKFALLVFL